MKPIVITYRFDNMKASQLLYTSIVNRKDFDYGIIISKVHLYKH